MSETGLTEQQLLGEIDRLRAQVADMTEVLEDIQGRLENDPTFWPSIKGRIDAILAKTEDK